MSMDVRKVKLDFNRSFQFDIPSVQGDTGRSIEFQIMNGSLPIDITGETVKIFGLKPDGFRVFNNATITDAINGKCTVDLTPQMLCVAGTVQCTLVRYENNQKLSSKKFNITVAESVADDIEIESTSEYLALIDALGSIGGGTGAAGKDGATFIPHVDSNGNLSWTNNKGLSNPTTVNIKGPKGDKGDKGDPGESGSTGTVDAYTKTQINTMLEEYSKVTHVHTKEQITDFPTKLSEFVNDLSVTSGGKGQKIFAADIVDYGAKSGDGVYNTSSKTYANMTDCTQAVKDAIAAGYGAIIFPAGGKFKINGPISITSKIIILGCGAEIYADPVSAADRNIFVFGPGSDGSKIYSLNFISKNVYTANLANATALSSNCFAFNIAGNSSAYVQNIYIDNCTCRNYRYFVSIMKAKSIIINNCYGEENYFNVYTGFNAYDIYINNCTLKEQLETDIYGHVLYLGSGTYGVTVDNCILEGLGANASNVVKCGADQEAYCQDVIVKNSVIRGKTKASFLYCHAHADVRYENCIMEFTCADSSAYCRLLQFNNYSDMRFKNCEFILDSIQRFTHTETNITDNILIFDNCNFTIKNAVNQYLLLDLVTAANFKLRNCNLDYSQCTKPINLVKSAMVNTEIIGCTFALPSGSTCGFTSSSGVSYTQTAPKMLIADTTIKMPSGNTTAFFQYVKGSTGAKVAVTNITLLNGTNASGKHILAESDYVKAANINAISW